MDVYYRCGETCDISDRKRDLVSFNFEKTVGSIIILGELINQLGYYSLLPRVFLIIYILFSIQYSEFWILDVFSKQKYNKLLFFNKLYILKNKFR